MSCTPKQRYGKMWMKHPTWFLARAKMAKPNNVRGSLSLSMDQHVGSFCQTRTYPKFIAPSSLEFGWQFTETSANKFVEVLSFVMAWGHIINAGVSSIVSVKASGEVPFTPSLDVWWSRRKRSVDDISHIFTEWMAGGWWIQFQIFRFIYMMYFILKREAAPTCVRGSHRCHNPW